LDTATSLDCLLLKAFPCGLAVLKQTVWLEKIDRGQIGMKGDEKLSHIYWQETIVRLLKKAQSELDPGLLGSVLMLYLALRRSSTT